MVLVVILSLLLALVAAAATGASTALLRMSRARAAALADPDPDMDEDEAGRQRERAEELRSLLDNRVRVLAPMWLVAIAALVGIASMLAVAAHDRWGTTGVMITAVIEVLVLFGAVGSAQARTLANLDSVALSGARRLGRFTSQPWWGWTRLLVRRGSAEEVDEPDGSIILESEIRHLAELAAEGHSIDADDQVLIESSLTFGDTLVREVMVPRPDMITVPATRSTHDVLEMSMLQGFSRLPVTGDGIDDVVGIVHARNLMAAMLDEVDTSGAKKRPLRDLWSPARFVPETKNISKLLREMQEEKFHMAIVVDEYGGTAGLVTIEDLLEELVGEIVDEFDIEEAMIETLADGSARVNGKADVWMVDEVLGTSLPEGDWSTVGGLIFNTLGHVPERGECLELDGCRLEVEDIKGSRIARVRITPMVSSDLVEEIASDE